MTILRPNLTPEERVHKLLTLCVYATLIAILALVWCFNEASTLYVVYVHGQPSHPLHPLWVDWFSAILTFSGALFLFMAILGWLREAEAIHRTNQSG